MKIDVSHHGILSNLIFWQFLPDFSGKNRIPDPENRIPNPEIYLCLNIFGLKHVISFFAVTLIWCKILREIQKMTLFLVFRVGHQGVMGIDSSHLTTWCTKYNFRPALRVPKLQLKAEYQLITFFYTHLS